MTSRRDEFSLRATAPRLVFQQIVKGSLLAFASLVLSSCHDASVEPHARSSSLAVGAAKVEGDSADPGMVMRLSLRGQSDASVVAEVSRAANIVIVGLRDEGASRGVDRRGNRLITQERARLKSQDLRGLAKRVIYEFQSIPAVAIELPAAGSAIALRKLPWVDYIQPNTQGWSSDQASSSCAALSSPQVTGWHLSRVRAPQVWSSYTGTYGSLLVLDDGVNTSTSTADLSVSARYRVSGAPNSTVVGEHGTVVSSVAAARNNGIGVVGISPAAAVADGIIYQSGLSLSWQSAAARLIDAAPSSTSIVNISSSSKDTFTSTPPSNFVALLDAINAAVYNRGMLVVASTGNQSDAAIYSYPAQFYSVIGVGGSGYSDEPIYANYSPGNIDLVAPATDISSLCPGAATQATADGTSFSTPQVAGALMLLKQKYPSMGYEAVRQRLFLSSSPTSGVSTVRQGWGVLDVTALVNLVEVSISGPQNIPSSGTYTFEAMPTGGSGVYTYEWYGYDSALDEYVALGTTKSISVNFAPGVGYSWFDVVVRSDGKSNGARLSILSRP